MDIASTSGTEDPGSYPARIHICFLKENVTLLLFICAVCMYICWKRSKHSAQQTRVRIPPVCKVFRKNMAMLLCVSDVIHTHCLHCLCVENIQLSSLKYIFLTNKRIPPPQTHIFNYNINSGKSRSGSGARRTRPRWTVGGSNSKITLLRFELALKSQNRRKKLFCRSIRKHHTTFAVNKGTQK
jgi:hypothetical protein